MNTNVKTNLIRIFSTVSAGMFIATAVIAIFGFDYAEYIPYSLCILLGSVFAAVFLFIKKKTTIFFGIAQALMSVGAMISTFLVDDDLILFAIFMYSSLLPVVLAYFFLPTKFNSPKIKSLFGKLFAVPMLINIFVVLFPTFYDYDDINFVINIFFMLSTAPCYVTIFFETLPEKAPHTAVQPVYVQQPVVQPVYAPPVTETTVAAPVAPVEVPAAPAANPVKAPSATDVAAELKKYKDLLDSELITQEDFDAKKKQLLGL